MEFGKVKAQKLKYKDKRVDERSEHFIENELKLV